MADQRSDGDHHADAASITITDKLAALAPDQPYFSFEFFPPVTRLGLENLHDRIDRMARFDPLFVTVTWGTGGSTAEKSLDLATSIQRDHGLTTCMHLTCTNMDRQILDDALARAKAAGVRNVLALRGDPPRGQEYWTPTSDDFHYAIDLVRYIRKAYGDWFCIGVAAYPEGHADETHPESLDVNVGNPFLADKVRAGADFILTQMFYDVDAFVRFVDALHEHDAELFDKVPIIPALMPIQSYQTFMRMTSLSHAKVPRELQERLDAVKNDDEAVKQVGIEVGTKMIAEIRQKTRGRVRGTHFCTLNLERSVALILRASKLSNRQSREASPVRQTRTPRRRSSAAQAGIRRANVPKVTERFASIDATLGSKVNEQPEAPDLVMTDSDEDETTTSEGMGQKGRDATWDDFPNGRFGDSRSPAYGEIDGWGVTLNMPPAKARAVWGSPTSTDDVTEVFVRHIKGETQGTPWSSGALSAETEVIKDQLLSLNKRALWTVGSQPAVNCAESSDPVFGWGPRDGYVYQKSFIELFVAPDRWEKMRAVLDAEKQVSYYAGNRKGDYLSNMKASDANAVTWGIFPGKDIAQTTIIEEESFKAWKQEAFALWLEWAHLYSPASPSAQLIKQLADNCWLVTIVHHGFKDEQALWRLLEHL